MKTHKVAWWPQKGTPTVTGVVNNGGHFIKGAFTEAEAQRLASQFTTETGKQYHPVRIKGVRK